MIVKIIALQGIIADAIFTPEGYGPGLIRPLTPEEQAKMKDRSVAYFFCDLEMCADGMPEFHLGEEAPKQEW